MRKLILGLLIPLSVTVMAAGYDAEIQARQDAYSAIGDNVKAVGGMLKSGEIDFEKLEMYGEILATSSASLKDLFPEGSQEGSNARKAIWEDKDDFSTRLSVLDKGLQDFYTAAKNQDQEALTAAFEEATGTCKGCHRKYRAKM